MKNFDIQNLNVDINCELGIMYYYSKAEFIDWDILKAIIPVIEKEIIKPEEFELEGFENIEDVINTFHRITTVSGGVTGGLTGGVNGTVNGTIHGIVTGTLNDAINEVISKNISDAVKKRLVNELVFIIFNKGVKLKALRDRFTIPERTAKRDTALLKKIGFLEFKGAPKTGHYVITDKIKKLKLKRR